MSIFLTSDQVFRRQDHVAAPVPNLPFEAVVTLVLPESKDGVGLVAIRPASKAMGGGAIQDREALVITAAQFGRYYKPAALKIG